jgi:hypothetical protein
MAHASTEAGDVRRATGSRGRREDQLLVARGRLARRRAVAVSGSDYHGLSSTPAGLKLIDTEAWGVRTPDPGASVHRLAEGTLFALGGTRDGKTETETAWV